MTIDQAIRDPMFLKAGGAVALYLFGGGSRNAKWAAAALAAWAAWDWYSRPRVAVDANGRPVALAPIMQTSAPVVRPLQVIPGGLNPGWIQQGQPPAGKPWPYDRSDGSILKSNMQGAPSGLAGEPDDGVQ